MLNQRPNRCSWPTPAVINTGGAVSGIVDIVGSHEVELDEVGLVVVLSMVVVAVVEIKNDLGGEMI